MVKNRNSSNQKEKKRKSDHDRIEEFINKKEEEKLEKGMIAREDALQKAGMTKQEDNFADHAKIYNYADELVGPPIKTIDANVEQSDKFKCYSCGTMHTNVYDANFCPCGCATRGKYDSESDSPLARSPLRNLHGSAPLHALRLSKLSTTLVPCRLLAIT